MNIILINILILPELLVPFFFFLKIIISLGCLFGSGYIRYTFLIDSQCFNFHFSGSARALELVAAKRLDLQSLPNEKKGDPRYDIQSGVYFSNILFHKKKKNQFVFLPLKRNSSHKLNS